MMSQSTPADPLGQWPSFKAALVEAKGHAGAAKWLTDAAIFLAHEAIIRRNQERTKPIVNLRIASE